MVAGMPRVLGLNTKSRIVTLTRPLGLLRASGSPELCLLQSLRPSRDDRSGGSNFRDDPGKQREHCLSYDSPTIYYIYMYTTITIVIITVTKWSGLSVRLL